MITVNGSKMSRSVGNVILTKDLLVDFHPEVVKMVMFMHQYRAPMNWVSGIVEQAEYLLEKIQSMTKSKNPDVFDALNNDFNSPKALGILFKTGTGSEHLSAIGLGVDFKSNRQTRLKGLDINSVDDLLKQRQILRDSALYDKADSIRTELLSRGIKIYDTQVGSTWGI